tara:strand:- start:6823 stop:7533 length:711 start_codon:yes stop_codon:yes gene_type:complete
MIEFADLIAPMTIVEFEKKHRSKSFVVFPRNDARTELFDDIIDWQQFSSYINNDRAVAGMQAITLDGRKLCMEKGNLERESRPNWCRRDYYDKKYLHEIWTAGGSLILTKASLLTSKISAIAGAVERYYRGAADAHFYCSGRPNASTFPFHIDQDDNFLVHAQGEVSWEVSNSFENDDGDFTSFDLTVGDLLYIPKGLMHRAIPKTKRISISVPVAERKPNEGSLKTQDRKYYDFT